MPDNASTMLAEEVARLKDAAAKTTDTCIIAKYIALSDQKVQEHILKHLTNKEKLVSVDCLPLMIPEYKGVLFTFTCPDRMICIVPPRMLVTVDFINGGVVNIADPYHGSPTATMDAGGTMPGMMGELPLALDQPSSAASLSIPASELAESHAAESAFLEAHGLGALSAAGVNTPYPTSHHSPTLTGSFTRTLIRTGPPFNPDFRVVLKSDTKIDLKSDFVIDNHADPIQTHIETAREPSIIETSHEPGIVDDPNLTIREIGTIPVPIDPVNTTREGGTIDPGSFGGLAGGGGVNINLGPR